MKLANCATHRRPLAAGSRRPACHARLHPSYAFRADDSNNPNLSSREIGCKVNSGTAGTDKDSATPAWRQTVPRSHLASSSSNKRPSPLDAGHTQPLWKKPCFPGVVMITLATLPFDLAYNQHRSTHSPKAAHNPPGSMTHSDTFNPSSSSSSFGTAGFSSSSSSSAASAGSPPRHAKATAKPGSSTPASAYASHIGAMKHEASAAAAAAAGGQATFRQHRQQTGQHDTSRSGAGTSAGANAGRLAAEVANAAHAAESAAAAAQAAASRSSHAAQSASTKRFDTAPAKADAAAAAADAAFKQQPKGTLGSAPHSLGAAGPAAAAAAAAAAGRPVDSWDAGDAGVFSDEEAEQKAKAMVIELLTHPKDTEEALMRAAESGPGDADGSAGRPLSVSPDYIDALVQAVREPTVGMPHHQPSAGNGDQGSGGPGTSGSSGPGTTDSVAVNSQAAPLTAGAQADPTASPSAAASAAVNAQQHGAAGVRGQGRRAGSPSLWSWMEASPHSSQDEF